MKHLKLITILALGSLAASAAVPLRWTVETSRATPAQFEAYQGETLSFEAALQSYGKPLEAPSNYSLYWQTNGMGSTYWSVPVRVSSSSTGTGTSHSNLMYATWSPTNDVGAKVYNCFIGKPGTIYHAAFQLRLRPSPGATPNELPLPQKVIDFAKVTVLNPPWSGGGGGCVDTNAVREIAREEIAPATNAVIIATDAKLSPIEAQIASIASSVSGLRSYKRGLADDGVYSPGTWSHGELPEGITLDGTQPYRIHDPEPYGWMWYWDYIDEEGQYKSFHAHDNPTEFEFDFFYQGDDTDTTPAFHATRSVVPDPDHKLAKRAANPTTGALAKFDADGNLVGATAGTDYLKTHQDISGKRDITDNTCHKTETKAPYGDWVRSNVPEGVTFSGNPQPHYSEEGHEWMWYDDNNLPWYLADATGEKTSGAFESADPIFGPRSFNAERTATAVCTDGKKFVTEDVVDGKVSSAVSTNNPAFVSAVRNTPTENTPEDMPTDWGTYGTVGAALAALAAFVKWAKAKIVAVIGNDGKPTDDFATDLLGKPVAINALKIPLEAKADSFAAEDGHAYAVTMTGTVTITMPTTTEGKAAIFQARFSAAAQQSVQFDTDDVVKFDGTDCGIVKAGKDALLSAMWNGEAWDLVWKNEA